MCGISINLGLEFVQPAEPLLRGAENHGLFGPPVVRVPVFVILDLPTTKRSVFRVRRTM